MSIEIDLAQNLDHALELLSGGDPAVRPVAGATDALLRLHLGRLRAQRLVSIADLPELCGVVSEPSHHRLRAGTTVTDVLGNRALRAECPALTSAARVFASPQIRNRATVGGNVGNASPAADLVPPLIALGTRVVLISARRGRRELPLEELFLGPGKLAAEPDELVVELLVPRGPARYQRFAKFGSRAANVIAVVNMAMCLELEGGAIKQARVAYGSVAPRPLRALKVEAALTGQRLTQALIDSVAGVVLEDIAPIDDVRGSKRYKQRLAVNATQDALGQALSEARP